MFLLADGSKELSVTDNMGSVRFFLSSQGNRQHLDYKPFGGLLYSYTGKNNRENADGSIYDEESELQMMGARMYDDETGRFTSIDPLWAAFPAQSPYSYAYNSPLTWRDPSGLAPEKEKVKEKDKDRLQSIIWDPSLIEAMWAAAMADISMQNCLLGRYSTGQDADGQPMLHGMAICAYYKPPSPGGGGGSVMGGSHGGGNGGSRTAEGGSSENGQGGNEPEGNAPGDKTSDKKGKAEKTDDSFNVADGKAWKKMTKAEKVKALTAANNFLAVKSSGGLEWSYTIFEVDNGDGSSTIVATNFQTTGEPRKTSFDLIYTGKGSAIVVGAGHSHPDDGTFSVGDIGNMVGRDLTGNGFLFVALTPNYIHCIDVVNYGALSKSWNALIAPFAVYENGVGAWSNYIHQNGTKEWTTMFKMDVDKGEQCINCGLHYQRITRRIHGK